MARTQTVTILFCDLVASTERRARLGDDAFDEFTRRFMAALRAAISEHEGREVSNAGDGLMVVFPESVADAVACAIAMHRGVAALDPDDTPLLRIGISSGEVARDGDEFSGMPIVEAARLEATAQPGQTLANAIVRSLVGTRRALRFRDVGALTLKGIPDPLATVEVIDEEVVDAPKRPSAPATPKPPNARARRRWLLGAGVIVLIAAIVVGVVATRPDSKSHNGAAAPPGVPTPQGYTPRYTTTKCPVDVRQAAADATCGHLVVPQDRSRPNGKQVTLLVTRAPPRLPGPKAAPTIDVCGCENLGNSLARDHSELIHVGQRGYDEGTPVLTCPEFAAVGVEARTKPSGDPTEIARGTDALRTCHARLLAQGIDPAQYNYDAAAHDVLDLMYVLKIPRANFIAFELVGVEAFDVLRLAPGAVRSLTLDNPPPPGTTLLSDPIDDLAGAFGRYVAQCDADRTCARAYPNLAARYRTAYNDANAKPTLAAAPDPSSSTGAVAHLLLDGPRTADALAGALQDASTYKAIGAAITQPSDGSVEAGLVLRQDRYTADAPWGAQASYLCAYDVHTADPQGRALEAKTLPVFVGAEDTNWAQWCAAWKVPDVSGVLSADPVGAVPTLVFRGNLNSDGSPDWIPQIERGLSNVQALVFPTLGGDLLANGPACLSKLRREFLADPTAPLATAACVKRSPPIAFLTPSQ